MLLIKMSNLWGLRHNDNFMSYLYLIPRINRVHLPNIQKDLCECDLLPGAKPEVSLRGYFTPVKKN